MRTVFGELLTQLRKAKGITARRFALNAGLDPSYYGRIERGEASPPNEEVIARFAAQLDIDVGSAEWFDLVYRADIARGEIPAFALKDEIASLLPAFFARLRTRSEITPEIMYKVLVEIAQERIPAERDAEQPTVFIDVNQTELAIK